MLIIILQKKNMQNGC